LRAVRRRISQVRKNLLIVDPWFSKDDLAIISTISNLSVQVRILTAAQVLRENPTKNTDPTQQTGYQLQEAPKNLQQQPYVNPSQIKVLEGKDSPVHDRFRCVDDTVHLLGGSLNNLGENYSVLLTSPDSKPILLDLETFSDGRSAIR